MKTICINWSNLQVITIRDEIYVKVKNADLVKKQLDFNFLRRVSEPIK
jgi:ribonuclease R